MSDQPAVTAAQLNFELNNPNAPGTIYVSSNPADNKLTLVMSGTVAAGFTAGTLVDPASAPTGAGSLLYLYLTPLGLSEAEFDAIDVTSDGWTATRYNDKDGQYIGFTPTAPVTLTPPTSISFTIGGFTLAQAPGSSATLYVLAYRVTGIAGSFPSSSNIGVIFSAPDDNTGDLTTAMSVSLSPDQVVNSISQYAGISNQLILSIAQQPNAPTIKAGSNTAFTLNFVYATDTNGYGALLTVDEGKQLQVTAAQGTTNWQITPHKDADPPFWTLTPPAGHPLFATGSGTLAFNLDAVTTTFQPGPTQVILGYSNVPGYKNGSFAVTLVKEPHVVISDFAVSPQQSVLSDGVAQVTLSWATTSATRLTLQPLGTDVTGLTSAPATIGATTQFTLVAEGQRPGNVDNVASLSALAQVLPVINNFTASPSSIYVGDFGTGYPTNLAWNVNTNDQVTLASSTTGPVGGLYPAASSAQLPLSAPQMLTLTPKGGSQDPTVSRSLIVSGFSMTAQHAVIDADSGCCAAPSNASFVAVTAPAGNLVSILSTASYRPITTVATGGTPLGVAFSPDGTLMYVANSGDGTVSVYAVAVAGGQASPPFSFTTVGTVKVGGAPQSIAVSANGTVWVSVDLGATAKGQVVSITKSGAQYVAGTPVSVGQAPRGIALSPSGASLYVANSGDGTISQVTVTSGRPAVGTILTKIGTPESVAVTPDGKKLLVAASSDGAVYAYNTQYPATSPRQTYALPGATGLAVFPTGDYAIATGSGPNTAALLNYETATISTSQSLPAAPSSAAVTPEGGLCMVALPGSNSVEVLTFAEYAQVATTTAAGGIITSVAISPDNQTLVGWYDSAITVMGVGSPITGLIKGPVSGIGTTSYLSGTKLNSAVISPVVADDAIYVARQGSAEIDVYQLSTMASIATIPIPLAGFTARQAVALSASTDGKTVFALVADGGNQFSFVVIAADIATKTFAVAGDVVAYTARGGQVATPFAIGAVTGGTAAYAVDTTTATLWTLTGSGTNWSVSSSGVALAPGIVSAIPSSMAVTPDGTTAFVSIQAGSSVYIAVADLDARTSRLVLLPDSSTVMNLTSLAVSADGGSLYASDVASAAIRILDAASLRVDQTLTWQSDVLAPWTIAAASDGTGLFSANLNSKNIAIAQQVNPT